MRALVIYCHPCEGSFTSAVRDVVLAKLAGTGIETRLTDLYARGFDPVLSPAEHECYERHPDNCVLVQSDVDDLKWADTIIFVYPTWWYGLPAMLKGWLDRVFLPEVAFLMPTPQRRSIHRGLEHITRLGVFTTCGAPWWLTMFVGAPGKRTLFRGVGLLCAPRCKKTFAAHYLMDSSTDASRQAHLDLVARRMDHFLR